MRPRGARRRRWRDGVSRPSDHARCAEEPNQDPGRVAGPDVDDQLSPAARVSLEERRHLVVAGGEPKGEVCLSVGDDDADDLREGLSFRADLSDAEASMREGVPALAGWVSDPDGAGASVTDLRLTDQKPGSWLCLRGRGSSDADRQRDR